MTIRQSQRIPAQEPADPGRRLRWAWTAVAMVPVFFVIGFAVGEGIYALTGHDPANGDTPLWADLVALVPVVVVVLIPCVAAVYFGRQTSRSGDRRGRLPLAVGAIAGLGLLVLTVVSEVGDLVRR